MHMEPEIVTGAKVALGYATAVGAVGYGSWLLHETLRHDRTTATAVRSLAATALAFCFFEMLPHHPVGVSEVHLILGSTLYLLFGAGPAAFGLAAGLLISGCSSPPSTCRNTA